MTGTGYSVDITNSSLTKVGSGPLLSASRATIQQKLDQSGTISIEASGADPSTAEVLAKRIAQVGGLLGTPAAKLYTTLGSGTIDAISQRFDLATGSIAFTCSGSDLLGELANTSVLNLPLSSAGAPISISAALTLIMAFVPTWSIDTTTFSDSATKPNTIYLQFAGESVLAALNKVATTTGRHFRLGTNRQVVWLWDEQPSSGVRIISAGDGEALLNNDEVALIKDSLDITRDTHDIVTRIYPFGGGNADARTTLNDATDTAPSGYVLHIDAEPQKSYIQHTAAVALYGVIERQVSFKDTSPTGTTVTDDESAGNQLLAQSVEHLRLNVDPHVTYRFRLVKLDQAVYPGETIQLIFRRTVDGYRAIDEDTTLVVLDSTIELRTDGDPRTTSMTVATIDRRPASSVGAMVGMASVQSSMDGHVQQAAVVKGLRVAPNETLYVAPGASPTAGQALAWNAGSSQYEPQGISGIGAAPVAGTYITQTPDATLTAEQALSTLATGYMKVTTTTGVVSSQAVPIPAADGGTGAGALTAGSVPYIGTSGVYSQNNANLFWDNANTRLGIGTATPSGPLHAVEMDAGTTNVSVIRFGHNTSGTPAAGFGETIRLQGHSSTNTVRTIGEVTATWADATEGSRKGRITLSASDAAMREGVRVEASGSAPMLGFYGAAAALKPTITGSRGGNAALASLLTALATLGLLTDSTTA